MVAVLASYCMGASRGSHTSTRKFELSVFRARKKLECFSKSIVSRNLGKIFHNRLHVST